MRAPATVRSDVRPLALSRHMTWLAGDAPWLSSGWLATADAKKTNPPAAAEPEPQPIEPEPPPAAPDPPGKTPAQAAAKSLKRARQKARKRAALATATSGAVT